TSSGRVVPVTPIGGTGIDIQASGDSGTYIISQDRGSSGITSYTDPIIYDSGHPISEYALKPQSDGLVARFIPTPGASYTIILDGTSSIGYHSSKWYIGTSVTRYMAQMTDIATCAVSVAIESGDIIISMPIMASDWSMIMKI